MHAHGEDSDTMAAYAWNCLEPSLYVHIYIYAHLYIYMYVFKKTYTNEYIYTYINCTLPHACAIAVLQYTDVCSNRGIHSQTCSSAFILDILYDDTLRSSKRYLYTYVCAHMYIGAHK